MYFGYQGICTRVGDVKPLLEVACLTCDGCGFEIYQVCTVCLFQAFVLMQKIMCQEVIGDSFNPISRCPSWVCTNRALHGEGHL